jgi:hypothetical protein
VKALQKLVWASGDAFFIAFFNVVLVNTLQSLSCTTEPATIKKIISG